MKKYILFLTFFSINCLSLSLLSMENTNDLHAIILPGQNGSGGENFHKGVIPHNSTFSRYETPQSFWSVDLGQGNCIKDFENQLNQDKDKDRDLVLYGTSQGTATMINWLAQQSQEQQSKVKVLVLESVLGSGNHAILHTVSPTYIPFARFWMPYAAKLDFPTYNPLGQQALNSVKKLPKKLPIILVHATQDPQLPVNDARKLYCKLKEQGNENVYLIEKNTYTHFPLTSSPRSSTVPDEHITQAINCIYQKHNLPYNDKKACEISDRVLKRYQPTVKDVQYKIHFDSWQRRIFSNLIDLVTGGIIFATLLKVFWKN